MRSKLYTLSSLHTRISITKKKESSPNHSHDHNNYQNLLDLLNKNHKYICVKGDNGPDPFLGRDRVLTIDWVPIIEEDDGDGSFYEDLWEFEMVQLWRRIWANIYIIHAKDDDGGDKDHEEKNGWSHCRNNLNLNINQLQYTLYISDKSIKSTSNLLCIKPPSSSAGKDEDSRILSLYLEGICRSILVQFSLLINTHLLSLKHICSPRKIDALQSPASLTARKPGRFSKLYGDLLLLVRDWMSAKDQFSVAVSECKQRNDLVWDACARESMVVAACMLCEEALLASDHLSDSGNGSEKSLKKSRNNQDKRERHPKDKKSIISNSSCDHLSDPRNDDKSTISNLILKWTPIIALHLQTPCTRILAFSLLSRQCMIGNLCGGDAFLGSCFSFVDQMCVRDCLWAYCECLKMFGDGRKKMKRKEVLTLLRFAKRLASTTSKSGGGSDSNGQWQLPLYAAALSLVEKTFPTLGMPNCHDLDEKGDGDAQNINHNDNHNNKEWQGNVALQIVALQRAIEYAQALNDVRKTLEFLFTLLHTLKIDNNTHTNINSKSSHDHNLDITHSTVNMIKKLLASKKPETSSNSAGGDIRLNRIGNLLFEEIVVMIVDDGDQGSNGVDDKKTMNIMWTPKNNFDKEPKFTGTLPPNLFLYKPSSTNNNTNNNHSKHDLKSTSYKRQQPQLLHSLIEKEIIVPANHEIVLSFTFKNPFPFTLALTNVQLRCRVNRSIMADGNVILKAHNTNIVVPGDGGKVKSTLSFPHTFNTIPDSAGLSINIIECIASLWGVCLFRVWRGKVPLRIIPVQPRVSIDGGCLRRIALVDGECCNVDFNILLLSDDDKDVDCAAGGGKKDQCSLSQTTITNNQWSHEPCRNSLSPRAFEQFLWFNDRLRGGGMVGDCLFVCSRREDCKYCVMDGSTRTNDDNHDNSHLVIKEITRLHLRRVPFGWKGADIAFKIDCWSGWSAMINVSISASVWMANSSVDSIDVKSVPGDFDDGGQTVHNGNVLGNISQNIVDLRDSRGGGDCDDHDNTLLLAIQFRQHEKSDQCIPISLIVKKSPFISNSNDNSFQMFILLNKHQLRKDIKHNPSIQTSTNLIPTHTQSQLLRKCKLKTSIPLAAATYQYFNSMIALFGWLEDALTWTRVDGGGKGLFDWSRCVVVDVQRDFVDLVNCCCDGGILKYCFVDDCLVNDGQGLYIHADDLDNVDNKNNKASQKKMIEKSKTNAYTFSPNRQYTLKISISPCATCSPMNRRNRQWVCRIIPTVSIDGYDRVEYEPYLMIKGSLDGLITLDGDSGDFDSSELAVKDARFVHSTFSFSFACIVPCTVHFYCVARECPRYDPTIDPFSLSSNVRHQIGGDEDAVDIVDPMTLKMKNPIKLFFS